MWRNMCVHVWRTGRCYMFSSLTLHFSFLSSVNLSSQIQPRWLASHLWGSAFLCSASAGVRDVPPQPSFIHAGDLIQGPHPGYVPSTLPWSPHKGFFYVKIILIFSFELKLFPYKSVNISLVTKLFVHSQLFQKKKKCLYVLFLWMWNCWKDSLNEIVDVSVMTLSRMIDSKTLLYTDRII